jgi:UDP-3-O-[3-hydroxymyristoyl] N-acetylglucosamine deacetylase/3-hydroxyacyl-[acyl-carrier-protein] dehydratase
MMETQKTIKSEIRIDGIGLHSGNPVHLVLKPSPANTGILFKRVDVPTSLAIKATIENIADPARHAGRQTTLGTGEAYIQTIEHLMAALHACGIDNLLVEIDSSELPALDGSSLPYVQAIEAVGLCDLKEAKAVLEITEPIHIDNGRSTTVVLPSPDFRISYTLSYNDPNLVDQHVSFVITKELYEKELASARTFCLKKEADALVAQGYGKGATPQNTLIFENNAPVDNVLRFPDEAARHKVVDLIGDLYMLGCTIKGHVITSRTGHAQNFALVKKLTELRGKKMNKTVMDVNELRKLKQMDIMQVMQVLPHRFPFLLVDRILDLEPGKRIVALKNVTINEPFFQGHFEGHPIMPGVLIVEAMAQAGGIVTMLNEENPGEKVAYFMSIDKAKFRAPVRPGDQMIFEVEVVRSKGPIGVCACKALVEGKVVCSAEVKFTIVDR